MTAIQDQLRNNHCYGCGTENPHGMQIKSHWRGDECVCHYTPRPEQCAGPLQYVYGDRLTAEGEIIAVRVANCWKNAT